MNNIFGASATVKHENDMPYNSAYYGIFQIDVGTTKTATITSIGDSSKLISTYLESDAINKRTDIGVKVNANENSAIINISLDNLSVGLSHKNGNVSEGIAVKLDLTNMSVSLEQSATISKGNVESKQYIDYTVNGIGILLVVAMAYSGGPVLGPIPA